MSNRSKGRAAELECKKLLEALGFHVILVKQPQKFAKTQDFFGLFDIIAFKKRSRKYIQVKCNNKPGYRKYEEWAAAFANQYESVELWIKRDYDGWIIYSVYPTKQVTELKRKVK